MKLSEMTDEQAAYAMLKAYRAACEAHDGESEHPSHAVNSWIKTARDARKARDAAVNTTGGSLLEQEDQPQGQDSGVVYPRTFDGNTKELTHIPNTPAVQALRALPNYNRLSKRPELPALSPDFFAK
jgi:hypothetical protein